MIRNTQRANMEAMFALCLIVFGTAGIAEPGMDETLTREMTQQPERAGEISRSAPDTATLLSDGVTRSEAVIIALSNNPMLQSAFDELGITRSDLLQARLYTNPEMDSVLRFPSGHGSNNLELELSWDIADLWMRPTRSAAAKAEFDRSAMQVASAVLNTVADARRAHDRCVLLATVSAEAAHVHEAGVAFRDRVYERFNYGYTTQFEKSMADSEVAMWAIEWERQKTAARIAQAALRMVLGLGDEALDVAGEIPTLPSPPGTNAELVAYALENRPDLRAAELGVTAAEHRLALERRSTWSHVALGPAYSHEPDGEDLWGVTLGLELPLLDNNRAQRAKAAAEHATSVSTLSAMRAHIRQEVVTAAERLRLALYVEREYRESVIPAREQALEYGKTYYNQMQLSMMPLLQARRELYVARRDHAAALLEALAAEVELAFVLGADRVPQPQPGE